MEIERNTNLREKYIEYLNPVDYFNKKGSNA